MRKALWALVASLVLVTGAARGQSPTLLRVGVEDDAAATVLQRARDDGQFARVGLAVDVVPLPRTSAGESGVTGGVLEIAAAPTTALAIAHDRNEPFSIVAAANTYSGDHPTAALIVPSGSRLGRARDFTNKTIGVPALGDVASFAVRAWVDRDHAENVQLREVRPGDVPAALDSGRIDGAVLSEPALGAAVASGKYRIAGRPFDAIAARFVTTAYYARTDWILANRDAVERFITAMGQAGAGTVAPADVQPVIALLVRYQLLPKAFPAEQIIYPGALPTAARVR